MRKVPSSCCFCYINFFFSVLFCFRLGWIENENWYAVDWHGANVQCPTVQKRCICVSCVVMCACHNQIFRRIRNDKVTSVHESLWNIVSLDGMRFVHCSQNTKSLGSFVKLANTASVVMQCSAARTHKQINVFLMKWLVLAGLAGWADWCEYFGISVFVSISQRGTELIFDTLHAIWERL